MSELNDTLEYNDEYEYGNNPVFMAISYSAWMPAEVAKAMGVTPGTVYRYQRQKWIKGRRINNVFRALDALDRGDK